MVILHEIGKVYRTKEIETVALNSINMHIKKGEFVAVMGPSGSGKSTLLNIMGLIDIPTSGGINIDGLPVMSFKDKELAKLRNKKIGFIFQNYHLISDLNILDNVEIPLIYRRMSGAERRRLALEALDSVGLSARVRHFPAQLSGGQSQRAAIARAIAGSPELLLADEPTGNLDSAMGNEIMNILTGLNKSQGTTIVMVTHDESMARRADRIIRFFDGRQII